MNPDLRELLARAARSLRQATETENAYQAAEKGSDDELRCSEAIEELQGAVWSLEWTPEIGEALGESQG